MGRASHELWHLCTVLPRSHTHVPVTPLHLCGGKSRTRWMERVKRQGEGCTERVAPAVSRRWEMCWSRLLLRFLLCNCISTRCRCIIIPTLHESGSFLSAPSIFSPSHTFLTSRARLGRRGWWRRKCIMGVPESEHVLIWTQVPLEITFLSFPCQHKYLSEPVSGAPALSVFLRRTRKKAEKRGKRCGEKER